MKIIDINVAPPAESLVAHIASPKYPQALGGVLWRYRPDRQPDGKAGEFLPDLPEVPLGSLTARKDHFFRLEGYVIHHNDNPPTPYQVVVTITADGRSIHSEVPEEGGTGTVGDKNQAFVYLFRLREVP